MRIHVTLTITVKPNSQITIIGLIKEDNRKTLENLNSDIITLKYLLLVVHSIIAWEKNISKIVTDPASIVMQFNLI